MDDRGVIENLMARYAQALDNARFEELGRIFANASVKITGGPQDGSEAAGEDAVAALYRSIVAVDASGNPGTRHFLTNFDIEIDDAAGTAAGKSYFAVTQATPTLPLQIVACGEYHDAYARTDGVWTFESRHIVCDQVGDLTEHML